MFFYKMVGIQKKRKEYLHFNGKLYKIKNEVCENKQNL